MVPCWIRLYPWETIYWGWYGVRFLMPYSVMPQEIFNLGSSRPNAYCWEMYFQTQICCVDSCSVINWPNWFLKCMPGTCWISSDPGRRCQDLGWAGKVVETQECLWSFVRYSACIYQALGWDSGFVASIGSCCNAENGSLFRWEPYPELWSTGQVIELFLHTQIWNMLSLGWILVR